MHNLFEKIICSLQQVLCLLSSGNPKILKKKSSFSLHFIQSSNPQLFSTYFLLGSTEMRSKPIPVHELNKNISQNGTLTEPRKGLGLICLNSEPEVSTESESHDEFSSNVEKVYRILRKFHSSVPKNGTYST